MRRWWAEARAAAAHVADHSGSWLPGALAWCLGLGWIPLVLVVARPPSVADLTFLGARIYTGAAWPWNAIAAAAGGLLLVAVAFLLVTLAEASLLARASRVRPSAGVVGRLLGIGFVAGAPVLAALLATGVAAVMVAMREFTAPTPGDPMLRTMGRLMPFLAGVGLAWLIGGVVHAAASRAAVGRADAGIVDALAAVPRRLRLSGTAGLAHALVLALLRLGYVVFATVLLGVLWAPIGLRLAGGSIDPAAVPLLVGFVAIWLCLLLGGGALHAWGSLTWTRVLAAPARGGGRAGRHAPGDPHRS